MSPLSIISRSDDSPSTSYSLTSRKRSIEDMELQNPLSASIPERGNPFIEEYLLRELTKQIREGWLSPEGVKRVLEKLETERHPKVESSVSLQDSKGEELSGIPFLFRFTDYRTDCCHSPSGFPCCAGGESGAIGFNARYRKLRQTSTTRRSRKYDRL